MSVSALDMVARCWAPAVSGKIPDSIISSDYTTARKFIASFERDRRPCIEKLLTHDYQRIWWREKALWEKMSRKTKLQRLLLRGSVKKKLPGSGVSCSRRDLSTSATDRKTKETKYKRPNEPKANEANETKNKHKCNLKLGWQDCVQEKLKDENAADRKQPATAAWH